MAKALDESEGFQEKFQQECVAARAKLISVLTREDCRQAQESKDDDLEKIVEIDGGLDAEGRPTIIISKLAYSRDVEALIATLGTEEPFVPCGYYPSYRRCGETYYLGINIQHLVALSSENIWGIDQQALSTVLPESDISLLDLIIRKMTLAFEKRARIAVRARDVLDSSPAD